jgi:hypothetical protein
MFDMGKKYPCIFLLNNHKNALRDNLIPFSWGEHGWGYHFASSPRKVIFFFKEFSLKKLFKCFFPSIFFMEGKQNLKKTSNLESIG